MLVLNTNNQENTGGLYSNHMLYSYPDFSHILIYPNNDISRFETTHTPSGYTVNGLPVDCVDIPLRNQNIKNGTSAGGNVGNSSRLLGTNPQSVTSIGADFASYNFNSVYRFATIGKCKGGEIVGKDFTFMPVGVYGGTPQLYITNIIIQTLNAKLTFSRGLIHIDGTKEEIGNKIFEHSVTQAGTSSVNCINWLTGEYRTSLPDSNYKSFLITGTSEGGIAQEGDSVYVEMKRNIDGIMKRSSTSNGQIGLFYMAYLGFQGTPKDSNTETYPRPFQISIE